MNIHRENLPTYGVTTILLYYLHAKVDVGLWEWVMTTGYALAVSSLIIETAVQSNWKLCAAFFLATSLFQLLIGFHIVYKLWFVSKTIIEGATVNLMTIIMDYTAVRVAFFRDSPTGRTNQRCLQKGAHCLCRPAEAA